MRLHEKLAVVPGDAHENHVNSPNRRGGIGERGFALGEFEPEVVDVLGAGFDAPGGEGLGGEAGLQPVGEGLRRGEGVAARREVVGEGVGF